MTARTKQAGFTLTELMVVVVILSLLAAASTPLFTRDTSARKGRTWAKIIAQTMQKARFQAMADRANIHVLLYRARIDSYREEAPGSSPAYTLLSSLNGPASNVGDEPTVAVWDVRTDGVVPTSKSGGMEATFGTPTSPAGANDITFTPLGSTLTTSNWRIYIRNELLPTAHPDSRMVVRVSGLTGYITSDSDWTP